MYIRTTAFFAALPLMLVACATSRGFIPAASSSTPGSIALSPPSLSFTATGATNAQPTTASQANYSGTFTASTTTCSGIATIASTGSGTFSVSPVAAGTCSFTITGGNSASASLSIVVTTTTVGGS